MKKVFMFLTFCFVLSACENKTYYIVQNDTSEDIWLYTFGRSVTGRELLKAGTGMSSSTNLSNFTFYGVDTLVIAYKDKFYEEVSQSGYSILNKSVYVKDKLTGFEKNFVFAIDEDYIFSLPETERNDPVFLQN